MTLSIDVKKRSDGSQVVTLGGKLDAQSFIELEGRLEPIFKNPPSVMIFDLAGLSFISSMGIRVILRARKAVEGAGGKVVMAEVQPQVQKIFDIVAVLPKQSIFSSIAEADRYFSVMQEQEIERLNTKPTK